MPEKVIDSFSGRWGVLSNFSPLHTITAEHIFQAMKTTDPASQIRILMAETPAQAKRLGRGVVLRPGWDEMRVDVMKAILAMKFSRHPWMGHLLATKDFKLIEGNTWGDRFWGKVNGKGKNHLGMLLMEIRERIRNA